MTDSGENAPAQPQTIPGPVEVKVVPMSLQQEAIEMLKKQGIAFILLVLALSYLTNWVSGKVQWLQDQVPVHLNAIKEGYKEVTAFHLAARKEADERNAESIKEITGACKDALDRQERILMGKINLQQKQIGEVSAKVNSIMP